MKANDRQRLIKLIHVAKRNLSMADDAYRLSIRKISKERTSSSSDLTIPELERLMAHMKQCGFKVRSNKGSRPMADDAQSKKIRALWLDLHARGAVRNPSEEALTAYVKRMTGVAALQWLSLKQASELIEAMKKWVDRISE